MKDKAQGQDFSNPGRYCAGEIIMGLLSCFESFLLLPINVTYCNDYQKNFPRLSIHYKESDLQKYKREICCLDYRKPLSA